MAKTNTVQIPLTRLRCGKIPKRKMKTKNKKPKRQRARKKKQIVWISHKNYEKWMTSKCA